MILMLTPQRSLNTFTQLFDVRHPNGEKCLRCFSNPQYNHSVSTVDTTTLYTIHVVGRFIVVR